MMIYQLGGNRVILNSSDPNRSAALEFEGEQANEIRSILAVQYGAFGHLIGDATTPIDLHHAMLSEEMRQFAPTLIEGASLAERYDPEIPEDATT